MQVSSSIPHFCWCIPASMQNLRSDLEMQTGLPSFIAVHWWCQQLHHLTHSYWKLYIHHPSSCTTTNMQSRLHSKSEGGGLGNAKIVLSEFLPMHWWYQRHHLTISLLCSSSPAVLTASGLTKEEHGWTAWRCRIIMSSRLSWFHGWIFCLFVCTDHKCSFTDHLTPVASHTRTTCRTNTVYWCSVNILSLYYFYAKCEVD